MKSLLTHKLPGIISLCGLIYVVHMYKLVSLNARMSDLNTMLHPVSILLDMPYSMCVLRDSFC